MYQAKATKAEEKQDMELVGHLRPTTSVASSIYVKDLDTRQDWVGINPTPVDIIHIDVCSKVTARSVPEVVLKEAQNLWRLFAWSASLVELFGQKGALNKSTMLRINGEERGPVNLFPEIVAGL